jgi:hypothetical protein
MEHGDQQHVAVLVVSIFHLFQDPIARDVEGIGIALIDAPDPAPPDSFTFTREMIKEVRSRTPLQL